MEVTVAKSAGFCFGVKRAIDTVYQEIEKGEQVFTLGPIIHNEQVVQELADKGVRVIHSLEELAEKKERWSSVPTGYPKRLSGSWRSMILRS